MPNSKVNYSYIEKIVYSPQFRNMQDKTQLFYSAPKRQVRTRLTHTIEVKVIARDIGNKINTALHRTLIDLDLVDAIALAHDIGHTPFGHVGERTINGIVSRKDNLGGLMGSIGNNQMRFKHNVNSFRILEKLEVRDWRIIEGALCHTKIFYNSRDSFVKNPYDPFKEGQSKFEEFLKKGHNLSTHNNHSDKFPSLTLEGQIVAIADEIAQRVADISDGLESRYFESVKGILSIDPAISTRADLELYIRETLIDNVAQNTLLNLQSTVPSKLKLWGISHNAYSTEVVCFSPDRKEQNKDLEDFITVMMAQSEDVRESDSRSRYIIRQLFKAYLNDVSLLSDGFIDEYFGKAVHKKAFSEAMAIMENMPNTQKKVETFKLIQKGLWRYTKVNPDKNKRVIDMSKVRDFFGILIENEHTHAIPQLNDLFDEYILKIGFHIAGMTNTEAFTAYNRIYGH